MWLCIFTGYLVGKYIKISSGNQALLFLLKCKLTNPRMSPWIIAIQEHDFTVKYYKASANKIADTLSRYVPVIEKFASKHTEVQIFAVKYKCPETLKNTIKKKK